MSQRIACFDFLHPDVASRYNIHHSFLKAAYAIVMSTPDSRLKRFLGHLQSTLIRLVSPDEPCSVAEYASLDPGDFAQVGIPDTSPRLWHRLSVLERVGRLGNTLYPPLGIGVLRRLGVEDV